MKTPTLQPEGRAGTDVSGAAPGAPTRAAVTHGGGAARGLSARFREPELMDDPTLAPDRHDRALVALARVNRVSRAAPRLLAEVARVHASRPGPVRVLDVACGGGDVLVAVGRGARRRGIPVELHGCDLSPFALERAAAAGIETHRLDALHDPLPGTFDVVSCNLFLHHLEREEAVVLLRRLADAALEALVVQDLRRSTLGLCLAWIGLHTLTRSEVARVDGLRSVRAAFTLDELRTLCAEAELGAATVSTAWPERLIVRWRRA